MKIRIVLSLILLIMAVVGADGADCQQSQQRLEQLMQQANEDVTDHDFIANISKTDNPLEFVINISRREMSKDKHILGMGGTSAVLAVTDSSGRAVDPNATGDNFDRPLSEMLRGFYDEHATQTDSLEGRVRLLRRYLQPGVYDVKPIVRIMETGKDMLRGHFGDGGTVSIPAGNSVKVEVKPPWATQPARFPCDTMDHDFAATIAPTKAPYVYMVMVRRVNPKVDKAINTHHDVFADITLMDEKGRRYEGDLMDQTFAENISDGAGNDELGPNDMQPYPKFRKGRVRLIRIALPAGKYTIRPRVRIVEEGKDAARNPRIYAGYVAVPAVNSLPITVK